MNAIDGLIVFLVAIAGLCFVAKWWFLLGALFSMFSRKSNERADETDAARITQRAIRKASQHEQ